MQQAATKSEPAPAATPTAGGAAWRFSAWLPAAWLGLMTILAYQPVWHAGFIWDDDAYVTDNLTLRSVGGLVQIWCKLTATPQYYPLVHTSFWLEYHLWGLNPLGYHIDNVLLHTLAAILLWRVLLRLQVPGAWLAAGIFAVHPINVESVAWVTERKNVLAAVFYFAAALSYWRWREPEGGGQRAEGGRPKEEDGLRGSYGWYCASLALFIAALLSKTITCSFPAAVLLVIWWKRGRIARRDVWPLIPFFGVGLILGSITSWLERTHVGASGPEWAFSFSDRCLIAGRAVWFYAGKLFWPMNLTFTYPRWQIHAAEWWQWIFPVAALSVAAVFWALRRRIGRGPLVAALFFGGTLFPALGFANVFPMRYSFVADHFQYLASVGLIVLAVTGLGKILRPIPLVMAILPFGLAVLTWKQAHIYADRETLWQDTLAKNPSCSLAHNNLGVLFFAEGKTDEAISHFLEASRLRPWDGEIHDNLGTAYDKKGATDEAIRQFQKAIQLKSDYADPHNHLGTVFYDQGRTSEAVSQFEEAIRLKPDYAEPYNNLGIALYNQGLADQAISQYRKAIGLKPDYAEPHNNLGSVLYDQGKIDEAIGQYQEAIRLKPDYVEAYNNLGVALKHSGRLDEAVSQYQKAVRLRPGYVDAHNNLGNAFLAEGRIDDAISEFQAALRLNPDDVAALNSLGIGFATKGQMDAAIREFQEALRLKPDFTLARENLARALGTRATQTAGGQKAK